MEPTLLKEAIIVVDDLRQASMAGEINVPIAKGLFSIDEVYGTLSEVIFGKKQGRKDRNVITVFDSTGVTIEDIQMPDSKAEKWLKSFEEWVTCISRFL